MDPMTLAALAQMGMAKSEGLGAALGGGGSGAWGDFFGGSVLGGYLKGRSAKKAKKKAQKRFGRALNLTEQIQGAKLQQQEAMQRQANQQVLGGYDTARREASRLGRSGKTAADDRATQMGAMLSQDLQKRNLGSTTVGQGPQRGIEADRSRTYQSIDEGLAGLYGDLALGRGQAEAAGTSALSDIAGARGDLATQLGQMRLLGGATLGSLGSFDPGAWSQGYRVDSTTPMMEGFGSMMGGMGGGGMGGMNPQLLQWLFSQGGGMPGGMGGGSHSLFGSSPTSHSYR